MIRPAKFLACFVIISLLVIAPSVGRGDTTNTEEFVASSNAMQFVGETVTVCGPVVGAAYLERIRGRPTFLNFDYPYPNQTFTVVIWGEYLGKFERPPHQMFANREICVTGTVESFKGRPQIVVSEPDQIEVRSVQFESDRFGYEERVVLKALLAGLGHDVDYETGKWDASAEQAMQAFQEKGGLQAEEDRSPLTLRALAEALPRISEEDRTRALQLLLLNLAQREESRARNRKSATTGR